MQRCEFSLTLRFFLRLSQRQDKVYDRWFLFLSSFWIKAPSKRYRRSIVLGLSSTSQPPRFQMCIDSDTDTLMRKRSRTRQACPNCVGGQGAMYLTIRFRALR